MKCALIGCVLAILLCKAQVGCSVGRAVIEDTTEDVISEKTYDKIEKTFKSVALYTKYLKIAGVHTNAAVGVLKFLPQISALLKGAAFVMKLFRQYNGEDESEMVKKIKTSFFDVNKKLDEITSDLKNNRNLIRLSCKQRSIY